MLRPSGSLGRLGYRGFLVQELSEFRAETLFRVYEGIVDQGPHGPSRPADDLELESLLLETAGEDLSQSIRSFVQEALSPAEALEVREPGAAHEYGTGCPPCAAADAPAYRPGAWNVPSVQPHNNCYNYANDQITNTFAQPGLATGALYSSFTCSAVESAAQADGLRPHGNFSNSLSVGQGWYVALVIWPDFDFHWYRQDDIGCWSHKPGGTPARDLDNSGNSITDPRTADRGPYIDFCTYMITTRSVRIQ